ncbi:MAG: hypothetical protein GY716_07880 [bacterium]|nr:hypothetical protein [bacterium]
MTAPDRHDDSTELGRGRSGIVYRCRDERGREIARKVFAGDTASTVVHYVLNGAPNPYAWNEAAVECARLRRRIVGALVELWFGSRLCVADAYSTGWNEGTCSYRMDTRFVRGNAASLHHPFSAPHEGEFRDLMYGVMRPLQRRLIEAGLDGLVWQAGRSNPVALNNFLRLENDDDDDDERRWAWIDLESGVPALAPINPLQLIGFYLPLSVRHRRPLFDDVDVGKLRTYVDENAGDLERTLGSERFEALAGDIDALERNQDAWRSMRRVRRSITYRLKKGKLTRQQADWYAERPLRWYAHESLRIGRKTIRKLPSLAAAAWRRLRSVRLRDALPAAFRFLFSQAYRARVAQTIVSARIDAWKGRGQINDHEAEFLQEHLRQEGAGSYITDFGVHIAIKPAVKLAQYLVVPALVAGGAIGPAVAGLLIVFGGMIARSSYTAARMVQSALVGHRIPWIAFVVGLLPVIGNTAYPVQLVFESAGVRGKLAAFILYDTVGLAGEVLPIWGGRDTATEHRFNHLADWIVRNRA